MKVIKYTKEFSYVESFQQNGEEEFIEVSKKYEHSSILPLYYLISLLNKYKYAPFQ